MCAVCVSEVKQEKKCVRCYKEKNFDEFYKNIKYKKDGHSSVCKDCQRAMYRSPYKDFD